MNAVARRTLVLFASFGAVQMIFAKATLYDLATLAYAAMFVVCFYFAKRVTKRLSLTLVGGAALAFGVGLLGVFLLLTDYGGNSSNIFKGGLELVSGGRITLDGWLYYMRQIAYAVGAVAAVFFLDWRISRPKNSN